MSTRGAVPPPSPLGVLPYRSSRAGAGIDWHTSRDGPEFPESPYGAPAVLAHFRVSRGDSGILPNAPSWFNSNHGSHGEWPCPPGRSGLKLPAIVRAGARAQSGYDRVGGARREASRRRRRASVRHAVGFRGRPVSMRRAPGRKGMGAAGLAEVLMYVVPAVAVGSVVSELAVWGLRRWRHRRRGRGG